MGKKCDGLGEVIFDITTNVNNLLDSMEKGVRDPILSAINESRGLYWDHILPWAKEFEATWFARPEARQEVYIDVVDAYSQSKFAELVAQHEQGQVASVQVLPVIQRIENDAELTTPQFEGPTAETTGWSVYERDRKGLAHWAADFRDEQMAEQFGAQHAALCCVKVEPQPWKQLAKKQAQIITQEKAE